MPHAAAGSAPETSMRVMRPPVLLVLVVLALHLLGAHEVLRIHAGWMGEGSSTMPPRMRAEFTQEMTPKPPVTVRSIPPALAAQPPARPDKARALAQAASAAEPVQAPASVPAAVVEPANGAAATTVESTAPMASAASAPLDSEPGPEWPLSTRLSYVLTGSYRGPVSGQAQVEWLRKDSDYQIHLDVGIGPSFAPLVTRHMSSQGMLTPEGIAPQRYDEETKLLFKEPQRFNMVFLGGEVRTAAGVRGSAPRGAQDSVSQFVQLTWLFLTGRETLQPGRVVKFRLLLPSQPYDWAYEVVGEEMLETPMGPLAAWHLKPRQAASGNDLVADVWFAASLQYLPVRLVIRQNADTYIDLMLKSAPLQAAPESSNDMPRRPNP
ncbi:DUF3108 domain-containing protein [Roseateles sp. NT4]|uniref:DUF3108 domain-containing protein n=1 Tax=Roseateles sp. NT4 TaxID=3453715 RepID=UPI003EEDACD4